jgi:hypothetical protein
MPLLWECLAKLMHATDFTSRKIQLLSPLTNCYAICVLPTIFRALLGPLAAANSARATIVARGVDMDDVEMPRREPNLRRTLRPVQWSLGCMRKTT